eukprot:633809-Prorocentrum_minimum.AAC.1
MGSTASKFDASSSCCFSGDDGALGGGTGHVNGDGGPLPADFFGQVNFQSSDYFVCDRLYAGGSYVQYPSLKSFMYLMADATEAPTAAT